MVPPSAPKRCPSRPANPREGIPMQDPTARRVWDTALGQLQLQVTRPNYDTWLKGTVGLRADNGTFAVATPSDFVSEWLRAKMSPVIATTAGTILGRPVDIHYEVISHQDSHNSQEADAPPVAASSPTAAASSG